MKHFVIVSNNNECINAIKFVNNQWSTDMFIYESFLWNTVAGLLYHKTQNILKMKQM